MGCTPFILDQNKYRLGISQGKSLCFCMRIHLGSLRIEENIRLNITHHCILRVLRKDHCMNIQLGMADIRYNLIFQHKIQRDSQVIPSALDQDNIFQHHKGCKKHLSHPTMYLRDIQVV